MANGEDSYLSADLGSAEFKCPNTFFASVYHVNIVFQLYISLFWLSNFNLEYQNDPNEILSRRFFVKSKIWWAWIEHAQTWSTVKHINHSVTTRVNLTRFELVTFRFLQDVAEGIIYFMIPSWPSWLHLVRVCYSDRAELQVQRRHPNLKGQSLDLHTSVLSNFIMIS